MGRKSRKKRGLPPAPALSPAVSSPAAPRATWPESLAFNFSLLALVSAVLFRQVFLHPDQMLWGNDIERVFGVYTFDQHRALAQDGRLLLWDSTMLCGLSAVGNPTQIILSPFVWLFRLSASPLMFGLYFWSWVTLAAWGVFLWLRLKAVAPVGSFLAAVSFAFSAKTAGHVFAGHVDVLATMMCAPWLFWAAERLLLRPSLRSAAVLGAVLTISGTSGHLPTLYWDVFFVAVYVAIHAVVLGVGQGWARVRQPVLLFVLAGLVFLVGGMAWWLPIVRQTLLLSARSSGDGGGYAFASMFSAAPSDLLRFIWPFHGLPLPRPFASDPENHFFWETASYPGLVALVLAGFVLIAAPRNRDTRILGVLALLAIALALGPHTPVHRILYEIVPGVSFLRAPGRVLIYANLFLSALAGLGLAHLLDCTARRRTTFVAVAGTLLLVALVQPPAVDGQSADPVGTNVLSIGILAALVLIGVLLSLRLVETRTIALGILAVSVLDLGSVWRVHIVTADPGVVFPSSSVADFLEAKERTDGPFRFFDPTETVTQQLAARHGLETITGYDSAMYKHQLEAYHALWPPGERSGMVQMFMHSPKDIVCTTLLDLMNVRYVVAYEPALDDRFVKVFTTSAGEFERPRSVYERVDPLPWAFVVPTGLLARTEADALQAVCGLDPRKTCVMQGVAVEGSATFQPVPLASRRPGELRLDFETTAPGVLVVSEGWHPDWVATDAGRPVEVRRANYEFLGIPMGAGAHSIRVWYRPWDFYLGCWVSAVFWLGVAVWLLARRGERTVPQPRGIS